MPTENHLISQFKEYTVNTNMSFENLIQDYLEGDTNHLIDVSLSAIADYFTESDLTDDEILNTINQNYGDFIDLYYLNNEQTYVAFFGCR